MIKRIWMLAAPDDGGAQGGEPALKPEDKSKEGAPEEGKKPEGAGDNLDEFGYEKPEGAKDDDKKPEGKEEPKPTPDDKKSDPGTGYSEEPPAVDDKKPDDKKEETPPADDKELGYKLDMKDLPPEEATKVTAFAKQHGLTKEVAQALADTRKAEIDTIKQSIDEINRKAERDRQNLRVQWHKELKDDPNFGGDKFGHNIQQAEKVLEDFMPHTKKALTERKAMLPPYFMRDLAKMADTLFSGDKLTQGSPITPKEETSAEEDALAFYHQKAN